MEPQLSRNRSLPISRLPTETLCDIFSHLIPDIVDFDYSVPPLDHCVHLLQATHVCHDWRHAALACGSLWSTVVIAAKTPKLYISSLFIERSAGHYLIFVCDLTHETVIFLALDVIELLQQQIRCLRIEGQRSLIDDMLVRMKELQSPLEKLVIAAKATSIHYPWIERDSPFIVEQSPTSSVARQSLATLATSGCYFDLNSRMYSPHLLTLSIDNLPEWKRIHTSDLFYLLRYLPRLRNLSLIRSLTKSGPPRPFEAGLSDLQRIHLEEETQVCIDFLQTMHPSVVLSRVTIIASDAVSASESGMHPIATIIHTLSRLLDIPHRPHLSLLSRSTQDAGELTLSSPEGSILKIQVGSVRLYEMINIATRTNLFHYITSLDLCSTAQPQLSSIRLYHRAWTMLSCFRGLRTLRVTSGSPPLLLLQNLFERAMRCIGISRQAATDHIGPNGHSQQIFPVLESIDFVDIPFSRSLFPSARTRPQLSTDTPMQDILLAFLWAVTQHPYSAPPRLSFSRCTGIDLGWVHELRKYTTVDWEEEIMARSLRSGTDYSAEKIDWLPPREVFIRMVTGFAALSA